MGKITRMQILYQVMQWKPHKLHIIKYYIVYIMSTCWLRTFLMLLRDVAKRQFQNMQNIHLDEKCISEANS